MKFTCHWCRAEFEPEKLAKDHPVIEVSDRKRKVPSRHGHRLYLVASGTVLRFRWAPTKAEAEAAVRDPRARKSATMALGTKARAATLGDLELARLRLMPQQREARTG